MCYFMEENEGIFLDNLECYEEYKNNKKWKILFADIWKH